MQSLKRLLFNISEIQINSINHRIRNKNSKKMETMKTRIESDLIGAREIPMECKYGVQTLRAIDNFPITGIGINRYPNIVKYLGITLLPQAGVALGMAIKAEELGDIGTIVANITLFSVLIYELVGPYLTKIALTKAGEIKPEGAVSARKK